MLRVINGLKKINKNIELGQSKRRKIKQDILPVFKYPISKGDDRRVYVWGLAEHGALGTIEKTLFKQGIAYLPMPRRLTFAEKHKVVDVACGYGFTAFAISSSDKNIIYGSGINTDSQLGFQEVNKIFLNVVTSPRPINLPLKNSTTEVISIAAGRAHLLILTNEGVFTLESGEVYTFGWGADGQTGLAHYRNEHQPSLVKGDLAGQHIIKVACVADCVLALSDKGKVFGWGNSEYGQLLIDNDNYQVNIATELNISKEVGHIVDIAAGGCFCMILNSSGEVYVWGYGILGLGPQVQRVLKPTLIPSTLFGNNAYSRNNKVINIYCGISHLAAVTNTGDLYMWGCNKFGSLGLGHNNDQFFPLKVSIGAHVKKVACGIDHTVTLCKPFI
ncbi:RCC1-like G exchanging factor-like protein isoform X2 [Vespula pensylvanica]|uniref:RCC1-like G exchanging factor-like protein isoform X2 n=1 Tax=Vespula pensylvanica TaxID=30213 RepID=UPI001CBA019D|nr:RCC1-like G exchanging factor-like protein isoform X2 [Vespula pensylvanica]XP_050854972.1 RCC1-like G exchanging factor-like protein isoform X2 [Vespula vulgaris]